MRESGKKRDNSSYRTKEYREKRKQQATGSRNGMYGKSFYDIWVKKYGLQIANKKLEEYKNKKKKIYENVDRII